MYRQILNFIGIKSTYEKLAELHTLQKSMDNIESMLDVMADEYTTKNEIKKSVSNDPIIDQEIKDKVDQKFYDFSNTYNKELSDLLENRRVILKSMDKLKNDPNVLKEINKYNSIKKAYLEGQISTEVFLYIIENENEILKNFDKDDILKATSKQQNKVATVMREFHEGDLKSGSGHKVTSRKQAQAIGMSEAGISKAETRVKTLDEIAKKHNVPVDSLRDQLRMGMKVEAEHTDNKTEQRKIALDHLYEVHNYYTKLKEVEKEHDQEMDKACGDKVEKSEEEEKECPKDEEHKKKEHKREHKPGECPKEQESLKEEEEKVEKADYFNPATDTSVDNDLVSGDKDEFLTKKWLCKGYNVNDANEIDEIDFELSEHDDLEKAEYEGKDVSLNQPTKGDVKKYKVYVRNNKGNVQKVEFGDPNMEIKRDNPERRRSFRARHKCSEKKDKTSAGYWACKTWSNKPVSSIVKSLEFIDQLYTENDITSEEFHQILEKAKAGVYADNEMNRKLGRAGEKYGKQEEDEDKKKDSSPTKNVDDKKNKEKKDKPQPGKKPAKEDDEFTEEGKLKEQPKVDVPNKELKKLKEYALKASAEVLQAAIKQSDDPKLRAVAQEELDRRKNEEVATKSI